jgi:hypothetical protein
MLVLRFAASNAPLDELQLFVLLDRHRLLACRAPRGGLRTVCVLLCAATLRLNRVTNG